MSLKVVEAGAGIHSLAISVAVSSNLRYKAPILSIFSPLRIGVYMVSLYPIHYTGINLAHMTQIRFIQNDT
jgi:hypothetical protein